MAVSTCHHPGHWGGSVPGPFHPKHSRRDCWTPTLHSSMHVRPTLAHHALHFGPRARIRNVALALGRVLAPPFAQPDGLAPLQSSSDLLAKPWATCLV